MRLKSLPSVWVVGAMMACLHRFVDWRNVMMGNKINNEDAVL